ncbi:hypothetical protein J132_04665 [Termitomyces sp. J132]|nr:hypothetical protein J132_04665 [Termitomyces sp. J132]
MKKRCIEDEQDDTKKRGPGRPRGSGPKQRAQAKATALSQSRNIAWIPGVPLKIPGTIRNQVSSQDTDNTVSISDSLTSDQFITSSDEVPPLNDGRSAINRVRDHVDADAELQTIPLHNLPADLPNDSIHTITDDVEDSGNLRSFASEGLGPDEIEGDDDEAENGINSNGDSKNWRQPHPSWFQKIFQSIIEELTKDRNGLSGRSRHYTAGIFWLPCQAVWFHLSKQNLRPTDTFLPKFFYWDPLDLLKESGIPCPTCGHALTRHGFVDRPRRVVDIDTCFWLIGALYRCRMNSMGGCGKIFRSWDFRILDKLPRPLAAEFPAKLTWRSALSWRAFGILRSCIQHGMGASEVAEMFRMQHLQRYDEIRLQYLHTKAAHIHLPHQHYEPFLSFEDQSDNGFHGFTPSGQWLRDVYDDVMEGHRDTLNQHTAMLPGRVCAIDHSHKIAKHVFKVNGVSIFTALLTVTNENGEICVCLFVATKSHSQYAEVLRNMSRDLTLYGHSQPELFYTDNMQDKGMLEHIFTSLLDKVTPIEKYSHLPNFSLPHSCTPQILNSASEINNAIRGILNDLPTPSESQLGGKIVVGFDSEWNMDTSPSGHIVGHGPPAVVQIAYKNQVFILQIGEMLSRKKLPYELLNFLKDHRLAIAAGEDLDTFQGGLDLASFAKQRLLITNARISLAELTAVILGKCLSKNQTERISSNWSDQELTADQTQYAACDAYACLCLFHKISESPEPTPLSLTSKLTESIGQPVLIMTTDNKKIAARGTISKAIIHSSFDNINFTPTRIVVSVHEVNIPATIMTQHRRQPLSSMGSVPFDVVVHRSHIWTLDTVSEHDSQALIQSISASLPHSLPLMGNSTVNSQDSDSFQLNPDFLDPMASETSPSDDTAPIGELLSSNSDLDSTNHTSEPSLNNSQISESRDPHSVNLGSETLGPHNLESNSFIRSRVLKDVFHVFNMLYISWTHGLRVAFAQTLCDALFVPHPDDKAHIESWLRMQDLSWDDMLRFNPTWLWRRCRCTIPPPEILFPLVHDVFMTWGALKDARTQLPLFNDSAWKTAKNILELIRNGFISDPPGIPLYYIIGLDMNGLPIYRCIWGTNSVKGGVHTHLRTMLPSCGASVHHMVTCLLDFILHHNLLVGTFNTTGKKYIGHDSIWLLNEIQELEITLTTAHPSTSPLELSFVNGNLYQQTTEATCISRQLKQPVSADN